MHISLDAALQRQPLLSTVGDKLLPTFPGAAAAYSLRALNGDANDVVKVRRDADNEERDFTAEGVQFELENWVNGKQETTLPADVATASAAYSLRKVRDAYTGNALQVRRPSDDVEVNVAFDANGEVSASSGITNIPVGNFPTSVAQNRTGAARYGTFTTDGLYSFSAIANSVALGGYVIDEGDVGDVVTVSFDLTMNSGTINSVVLRPALETGSDVSNSSGSISSSGSYSFDLTATDAYSVVAFIAVSANFTVSNVSIQVRQDAGDTTATTLGDFLDEEQVGFNVQPTWAVSSGDAEIASQSSTATTSTVSFSTTSGGSIIRDNSKPNHIKASNGDQVVANITTTGLSGSPRIRLRTAGTNTDVADIALQDGTNDHTFNLSGDAGYFIYTNLEATSGATITINSVKVISKSLFVVTWYDQSGNGDDATQDTAGEQPKIASAGSLIADGINFFSGLNLELAGTGLDIFKNVSYGQIFSVIKPRETGTGSNRYFEASIGTGSGARFLFGDGQDTAGTFRIGGRRLDGDSFGDEESPTSHSNQLSLITGFLNYTDAEGFLFLNGAQVATDSIPNMTAGNTSDTSSQSLTIGANTSGLTSPFNAKEFIIFNSDQSANRFKIESNINNHYGIYTPAEDGFVNTWYDQVAGNHAVAPADANEPKIVDNGSLVNNGKSISGANLEMLTFPTNLTLSNEFSIFYKSNFSDRSVVIGPLTGTEPRLEHVTTSRVRLASGGNADFDASVSAWSDSVFTLIKDSSDDITLFENGTSKETINKATPTDYTFRRIFSFGGSATARLQGEFSELVIYNSDQSANRTDIESNITSYYS